MSKFKGNQAFKQKLARRIMAVVLSGAMVMSNMSAYAAELAPEKETETVSAEIVSEAEETDAADSAKEEAGAEADAEKVGAESSVAESSESETEETASKNAKTEEATEDTAETDPDTEAVESTAAETVTAKDKTSETVTEKKTTEVDNKEDTAEEGTHIFDAEKELGTNGLNIPKPEKNSDGTVTNAEQIKVAADTSFAGGYFITGNNEGTTSNRANSSTYSLELAKSSSSWIQFTVTEAKATVVVSASSTGNNATTISLVDASGNTVAEKGNKTESNTSTAEDFTYSVSSGTYKVVAPGSARGARIYKITVTEEADTPPPVEEGLAAPSKVKAEVGEISGDAAESVTLTWSTAEGANAYKVLVCDEALTDDTAAEHKLFEEKLTEKIADADGFEYNADKNEASYTVSLSGSKSFAVGSTYYFYVYSVAAAEDGEDTVSAKSASCTAKIVDGKETEYKLTPSALAAEDYNNATSDQTLKDGMLLGDSAYFKTMIGTYKDGETDKTGSLKLQNKSGYIILTSQMGSSGITFIVEGTATAAFGVASTGGSNNSPFALIDSEGNLVEGIIDANATNITKYTSGDAAGQYVYSVKGTTATTITYNLSAGAYTFLSPEVNNPQNGENTRGGRICSISVKETSKRAARADWGSVTDPAVESVTWHKAGDADIADYEVDSITVAAAGAVGYNGGDKLSLKVTADGSDTAVYEDFSRVETKENKTVFTIPAKELPNGTYRFAVTLSRKDETDKTAAFADTLNYDVSLSEPGNLLAVRDGSVTDSVAATVSWDVVSGATSYRLAVYDITGETDLDSSAVPTSTAVYTRDSITAEADATTVSVTVDSGLNEGKTYRFCVYSVTDAETSKAAVRDLIITETVAGVYVFEASELGSVPADKTEVVLGGTDGTEVPLGTGSYYTLVRNAKNKIIPANTTNDNRLVFDDDYTPAVGFQFGGNYSNNNNYFKITTSGGAKIKVWWADGSGGRAVALYDSNGAELAQAEAAIKATAYTKTFEVSEAGTYRIGSSTAVGEKKDIRIYKIEVTEGVKVNVTKTFDGAAVYKGDIAAGTYKDGEDVNYVDDYFTVLYSEKAKVEKKSYTDDQAWSDGYTGGYRLNFGAAASTTMNAIKFTTTETEATVKVWWKAGDAKRHVQILDASGTPVEVSKEESKKDASYITKFKLTSAGTYYLGNEGGNNYLFKVSVEEGPVPDAVAWDSVAAPVIKSAEQEKDKDGKLTGNITVTFAAYIDELNGCEKVTVNMYGEDPTANTDAAILKTTSSSKTTASAEGEVSVTLTPDASGTYYFIAKASRAEETATHDSAVYVMATPFSLPLTKPSITRATNDGKGGVEIAYSETAEAEKYVATATKVTDNKDGTYTPVEGAEAKTATSVVTPENKATTAVFEGLEIGQYYAYTVHAVRGEENSAESDAFYKIVKDVPEQVWDFSAFGESTSTNKDQCGYSGDANDGEASVWSLGGKGKIVPGSTDGVSFYYTKVDKDTNFVLEATAVVDEWSYSNGQEGFGLMVSDTVGPHGYGTKFWNNSYMAAATKMEYYWNGSTVLPSTVGPADDRVRYNMYLGLGSIVRTGVTDEWAAESAAGATIPSKFVTESLSLEHAAATAQKTSGDYNILGNAKTKKAGCIDIDPMTEIKLRIEKNNTGYFITYTDKNGEETTHKFYEGRAVVDKDYANQSLLQIDKDNIYAGFFAARNAKATFKDIKFTTSSVDDGGEPEERPLVKNAPNYTILSASVSNTPEYEINFSTNWRGTLSIKDGAGRELVNKDYFDYLENTMTTILSGGDYAEISMLDKFFEYDTEKTTDEDGNEIDKLDEAGKKIRVSGSEKLKADVKAVIPIIADIGEEGKEGYIKGVNSASQLAIGSNQFTISFAPDRTWHKNDDELQVLSSYDTSVQTLNVSYRKYGADKDNANIYVSPDGKASGDGSKDAPLDIYTAVKYAHKGQTLVLLKGTYSLRKPLNIERGIDGTASDPIRMIAEPGSYNRMTPFEPSEVVIDFNGVASGMTMAGDYWYFRGFDVTNSSDGNKGIQVSGSYNVLDQVNTYYNGNTGIQISRYKGTDIDKSDDWPANNLILNCTSYLNADSGHEDADGFAAKLTIGDGNVFDGCIAAYNADDGWDFFAKSESGPIGQVVIKNSVTYKNGYLIFDENGKLDVKGKEKAGRGNGNGFKMGGESIKGYHMVINSYSFYNKAKGIDSNSCPDIQAYNCISYNNKNYNIAFYTGVAKWTEFRAANLISLRSSDVTADADTVEDQLKPTDDGKKLNDYEGTSNFYWDAGINAAKNKDSKTITTDWFKSTAYDGITTVSRNADGTINMGDFLAFKDTVDRSVFVKLKESTNEKGFKIYEPDTSATDVDLPGVGERHPSDDSKAGINEDNDTKGSIEKGDDEVADSTDIWTDDEFKQLDAEGETLKILLDLGSDAVDAEGYYHVAYTGLAVKPAVRVAYGLDELTKKNYSVSYKNNQKAYELRPGDKDFNEKLAPTVVIKGKGNYAGEYNLYFVIDKVDLNSDKVTSADITTVATGRAQKMNPAVTFDGKKLGAKDYAVGQTYTVDLVLNDNGEPTGETVKKPYSGNYETAGTYYMDLKAVDGGNFKGTKTVKISVLSETDAAGKTPMSKVKVDKIPDQIYDGTAHYPAVTVKNLSASKTDAEGKYVQGDYDIAYYNNTDIGIASVVLTGNLEKGYYGTKTVTFKTIAKPFNVKDYSVTVNYGGKPYTTDEDYKGLIVEQATSAVTFSSVTVNVTANEGSPYKKLTEGVDYTISYKGNSKAGSASIVIKGMGDFKGTMTRSFKITPFEITTSNTKVEPIGAQEYAKGGVKPSVIVKINGKTVSAKNYTVSYKNNNKAGTATVSITGRNLLKGSLKDIQSFEITPKNLRSVNIIADNVYYGTAKKLGDGIAYATKLAVKDGSKTLSLNSDYEVTYYEALKSATAKFDYNTGELVFEETVKDDAGNETLKSTRPTPLEKSSKIAYDGSNKTIYAVIKGGKNGLYEGYTFASYKVAGKNDIKTAKIAKITDITMYDDGTVPAPKLTVTIQNRHLEDGKYVKDAELTPLKLNEHYEIIDQKNNDRAGTCTLTLKGIGDYAGINKVSFRIDKKDLTAWNKYIANVIAEDIVVEVHEADVQTGGRFEKGITFDPIKTTETDAEGNPVEKEEASPLAQAANKDKIYTVGTKTSGSLTYGTDYSAEAYSNNVVDVSKLTFGEDNYATQTASVTIKGEGSYVGTKTITFTIKVKKAS